MNIKQFLLCLLTLLGSLTATAYDVKVGGIYYNINNGEASVTFASSSFNSYSGLVNIPDHILVSQKNYTVTSIDANAFKNCSNLTDISIPSSIRTIGEAAFEGCTNLRSANYASLESLCSITFIKESSNPLYYGHHLFINRVEITNLSIPNNVTSIGDYAFDGCIYLISVTIPESVTSMGRSAFKGCSGTLVVNCNIPDISSYYSSPFYGSSFFAVTFGGLVTSIGNNAFYGCSSLTSVTISNSVTSIGNGAFSGCSGLTEINIPNSVTTIGDGAFRSCSGLTAINIPNSVTSIGERTFYDCSGLTSVIISEGVTSIGRYAFGNCFALTRVEFYSIEHLCNISFGSNDANPLSFAHHLFVNGSEVKELVIPNSVTSIGNYSFFGYTGLTSVTIPESVTSIGACSFYGCTGLTSVAIPEGVSSIGAYSFYGCTGLTSVTLPESLISIAEYAFQDCSNLTSITIPEGVTSIGIYAFYGCSSLTSINIPDGVTSIGSYSFSGCTGLTSVTLPEGLISIAHYAFQLCSNLTSITIPEGVISIGNYAFSGCTGLTSITIPEGVISIGNYAFSGCIGLTSVTIPEGVQSIGYYSFYQCTGLTSVTIPNSMKSIGDDAFSGCSSLTDMYINDLSIWMCVSLKTNSSCPMGANALPHHVYLDGEEMKELIIPNDVQLIGKYNFSGFNGLTSVTIPNSVKSIGDSAFEGCSNLNKAEYSSISDLCTINFTTESSNPLTYAHNLYINGEEISTLTIPCNITRIKKYSFYQATGLTKIVINNDQHLDIEDYAFYGCRGLKELFLGSTDERMGNTITIGDYSFYESGDPLIVHIGKWVTEIGKYNFRQCAVHMYLDNPPAVTNTSFYQKSKSFFFCPEGTLYKYEQNIDWNGFADYSSGVLERFVCEFFFETSSISINLHSLYPKVTILPTWLPSSSLAKELTWESSNPYIAYVAAGEVTAINVGETIITASCIINNKLYSKSFTVIVYSPITEITLDKTSLHLTGYGKTSQLIATITPDDATNKSITWTSDNTDVATVSSTGVVTAIANGTATITATTNDGSNLSATCAVTVEQPISGDLNGDDSVDVGDIMAIINLIVDGSYSDEADLNGDDSVDVGDIMAVINIIIESFNNDAGVKSVNCVVSIAPEIANDDYLTLISGNGSVGVQLDNHLQYSAFQMIVTLPNDVDNETVIFNQDRLEGFTKSVKKITDGQYLIIGFSMDGDVISGSAGEILRINTTGNACSDIVISDPIFSTLGAKSHKLLIANSFTTDVHGFDIAQMNVKGNALYVHSNGDSTLNIYTVSGTLFEQKRLHEGVNKITLHRGPYIINNHKIVISK